MNKIEIVITNFSLMNSDYNQNLLAHLNEKMLKRKFQQTDDVTIQLRKSISYKKVRRQTTTMNCQ